jgi:hypothetical protein
MNHIRSLIKFFLPVATEELSQQNNVNCEGDQFEKTETKQNKSKAPRISYSIPKNSYQIPIQDLMKNPTKLSQLTYCEYKYNKHENREQSIEYTCNQYGRKKCLARIVFLKKSTQYFHLNQHNHTIEKLHQNRRILEHDVRVRLYEFIKENTHIRSNKEICKIFNNQNKQKESNEIITVQDVEKLKRKFYHERIYYLQDLYIRRDLSQTTSRNQFIPCCQGYPCFLLIYACNYQMNYFKNLSTDDQVYLDGTFDFFPSELEHMITIQIRRKNQNSAVPVMFIFLNNKDEQTYFYLWWTVVSLVPEIVNLPNIYIACDFEMAIINAIRNRVTNATIVGCLFHLLKAVNSWIKKNLDENNVLRVDEEQKKNFITELKKLSVFIANESEFRSESQRFLAKWRTVAGDKLYYYLLTTCLGDETINPRFKPETWSNAFRLRKTDLHETNNQCELFHRHLNRIFTEKPSLKTSIHILQGIEEEITSESIITSQSTTLTSTKIPIDKTQKKSYQKMRQEVQFSNNSKSKNKRKERDQIKTNSIKQSKKNENQSQKEIPPSSFQRNQLSNNLLTKSKNFDFVNLTPDSFKKY